jgi:predicted metal-dependent hydrolase
MTSYRIIRSRRKTIAIEIHPDGSVLVRAPLRISTAAIEGLVREKSAWIERKLSEAKHLQQSSPAHRYESNETFLYPGKPYPLIYAERERPFITLEHGHFVVARSSQPRAKHIFEAWYRAEAERIFHERIQYHSTRTGLHPARLRISSARTRWGSCSTTGTISLTWRLVMAPLPLIDYVILHELAHLRVKNHSPAFWNFLGMICPDFQAIRKTLKAVGDQFTL